MKKIFLVLAIIGILIISGCGGSTPVDSSGQQELSGASDIDLINNAEMKAKAFFYRGECDQSCIDIKEAYSEVIEEAQDIEIRSRARRRLAEFLFKIKEYGEGITVAKSLADTADNDEDRCIGIILIAQNARGKGDLELSFDMFNSAKNFCGEDKQDFIQDNMCVLTEQAGDLEGAKMMCPGKYS